MQNGHFNLDTFLSRNVEMQCSRAASVHESGSRFQGPRCCLHPYCVPSLFNENYMMTMNSWKDTLRSLKPNHSSSRGRAMGAPDSCITMTWNSSASPWPPPHPPSVTPVNPVQPHRGFLTCPQTNCLSQSSSYSDSLFDFIYPLFPLEALFPVF